jgi:hypothetical protein
MLMEFLIWFLCLSGDAELPIKREAKGTKEAEWLPTKKPLTSF